MLSSRRDAEFTEFVAARMTALRRVAYFCAKRRPSARHRQPAADPAQAEGSSHDGLR